VLLRLVSLIVLGTTALAHAQPPALTKEFQAGVDAFRLGKLDEARTHLEKARRLDPKLPGPHRFLAAVARAQERWDDCIASARTALVLNPRSTEADDTRKVHDECRASAGREPYRGELGGKAAIAVVTQVDSATVKINGLTYGGTPLSPRPITAGPLDIEVRKAGYRPCRTRVVALPGIVTDARLTLLAEHGRRSVVTRFLDFGVERWLSSIRGSCGTLP
jgi:tetratricopeptide (TPR) repeat protein